MKTAHVSAQDYESLRYTENTFAYNGMVFMLAGKCACSSIRAAMLQHQGKLTPHQSVHGHPDLPEIKHSELRFGGKYDDWPVVAVVRHPWYRLVSFWSDKVARRPASYDRYTHLGLYGGASFDATVQAVCRNAKVRDTHTLPLSTIYSDMEGDGQLFPTHVLRFETLQADWKALQRSYKWLPELPHKNQTSIPPILPTGRNKCRKLVQQAYAKDFHTFAYEHIWHSDEE